MKFSDESPLRVLAEYNQLVYGFMRDEIESLKRQLACANAEARATRAIATELRTALGQALAVCGSDAPLADIRDLYSSTARLEEL